jgi:hypothetical protein
VRKQAMCPGLEVGAKVEAWAQTVSQRAACLAVGLAEHEDESIQKFPEFLVVKEPKAPLQISVGDVVHLTAVGVADKPAPRLVPARPPGPGAEGGDVSHARASQSARTAQPATQQRHGVPLVKCDAHAGCPRERDAGQVVEAHEGLRVVSVAVFHPPVQEYQCGEVENVPIQEQVPAHAQARSAPPAPPPHHQRRSSYGVDAGRGGGGAAAAAGLMITRQWRPLSPPTS